MKLKLFFTTAMAVLMAVPAFAGGYLTNTNQSISFLRNPSQDAAIGITSLYSNPAGVNFLDNGFHLSIGIMNVHQNRDVNSTFPLYSYGVQNNGIVTKDFKGKAKAPVLPSLQASYNMDKWAFSFDFGLIGGGGKCKYNDGLPSFESTVALLPLLINSQAGANIANGYDFETFMRGRSYQYGFQFGAGYNVTDNLSVYGGVRLLYATNNYFGYVRNITVNTSVYGDNIPVSSLTDAVPDPIELNCNQTGWGLTPIVGVDWKINKHWNLAAKYEFKTKIRMENQSVNVGTDGLSQLDQFKDGEKVAEDVPGIFTVGAMYSPIDQVRINVGYHLYDDKHATKYVDRNKLLDGNTWEITAGAEWDFAERWTVSAGWQTTNYPNTDEYMNDVSFTTNSNTFGAGVKYQINKKVAVEAAYFQTIYKDYKKEYTDAYGLGHIDIYSRSNRVIGAGVTIDL